MAGFDHPSSCAPARGQRLVGDLFSPRADVRRQPLIGEKLSDLVVVIGAVQAQALGLGSSRWRPRDRSRLKRAVQQLVIVAVRAGVIYPDRDTSGVGENRALRPLLARSVGFGPVLGPPNGALVIAPSAARNDQSIPTTSSYSNKPWRQIS